MEFENGLNGLVLNLEEDNVGAVLLGPSTESREGDTVKRTGRIASIDVGEGMLGRVIDTLANPSDGKGEIKGELFEMPLSVEPSLAVSSRLRQRKRSSWTSAANSAPSALQACASSRRFRA